MVVVRVLADPAELRRRPRSTATRCSPPTARSTDPRRSTFFNWFQEPVRQRVRRQRGTIGNQEFIDDEVALSYTGVWNAIASLEAVGDDLLILPPPDFGDGPKIGGGSWQWGISSSCDDAEGAREYLEFSFQDEYIAEFADKQVVIPATGPPRRLSEYFGEDGALRPFVELSQEFAVLRPETPGLPGDLEPRSRRRRRTS